MESKTSVGQSYHDWTVIGCEFRIEKSQYVVCKCKCNKIDIVSVTELVSENNKRCLSCDILVNLNIQIGDKVGFITIINCPIYKNKKWHIPAKCECGWTGDLLRNSVKIGHNRCKLLVGYEKLSWSIWYKILYDAARRNIEVSMSVKDAWDLYVEQNEKCYLTGWQINITDNIKTKTASFDRINSSKSYEKINCQWLHKHINVSKWDLDQQWYIDLCHLVVTLPSKCLTGIDIETHKRYKSFAGCGNISMNHWGDIKRHAKFTNKIFSIFIEEAWDVYVKQGGRCALTGLPLYFKLYESKLHKPVEWEDTASLDRIDSGKGYENSNCQCVHRDVNIMKVNYSTDYFKEMQVNIKHLII